MSADTNLQPLPGAVRYHVLRLSIKALTSAYVRVRFEGTENLPPSGSYIACFNHPSWTDPFIVVGFWPDRDRRLFILGPREQDMSTGVRNRLIALSRRAVPFKPRAQDVVDMSRRALAVLRTNAALAIAGEGRLSDHEGVTLPIDTGLAHLALMARVPMVPVAFIGTRWVHFGSRILVRIGEPVAADGYARGRVGARAMTDEVEARLNAMLAGVQDSDPPDGRFARWFSELFNDRPWLLEVGEGESEGDPDAGDQAASAGVPATSPADPGAGDQNPRDDPAEERGR